MKIWFLICSFCWPPSLSKFCHLGKTHTDICIEYSHDLNVKLSCIQCDLLSLKMHGRNYMRCLRKTNELEIYSLSRRICTLNYNYIIKGTPILKIWPIQVCFIYSEFFAGEETWNGGGGWFKPIATTLSPLILLKDRYWKLL